MSHHVNELFSLKGKVAIVTGGAGYLGSAMAYALAEAGANVVIADIFNSQKMAEEISQDNPEALGLEINITDKAAVDKMIDETVKKFGHVDVLINCGGKAQLASFEDMTVETWEDCFKSYMTSTFLCTQAAYPVMCKQGGGAIINIASMYGMVAPDQGIYGDTGHNNPAHYGAAKGGVLQFTRYCASYMGKDNIRVNAISPGPFPHPKTQEFSDLMPKLAAKTMMDRFGQNWELKGAALFLASDASTFVTGQNMAVDGGWTAW